ncbi:hypothetical protein NM688_g7531 [Phlebia brevispora]|uniref:Uncharacterized protein n=1 Tax=Phlebia brevispora TaxID=194682 RepID=A0ACC1S4E9_9APHY|nr:hypothetical protein NM688_g7531 [Phlebia brevispora]
MRDDAQTVARTTRTLRLAVCQCDQPEEKDRQPNLAMQNIAMTVYYGDTTASYIVALERILQMSVVTHKKANRNKPICAAVMNATQAPRPREAT